MPPCGQVKTSAPLSVVKMTMVLFSSPARHEIFYFGGPKLGAIRLDDFKFLFFQQPNGWPGEKLETDMPTPINIRQDPFERTPSIQRQSMSDQAAGYFNGPRTVALRLRPETHR
jgi:hypothetical protein